MSGVLRGDLLQLTQEEPPFLKRDSLLCTIATLLGSEKNTKALSTHIGDVLAAFCVKATSNSFAIELAPLPTELV